jgi:hypothetical protein
MHISGVCPARVCEACRTGDVCTMDETNKSSFFLVVPVLLLLEVLATLVDLTAGPWGAMSTEERWNARAGVQLACGHLDAIWALQYKWNCGGCTAEAVVANPLFRVFGATVLAWKLVPAAIHVAIVMAGSAIAGRAAGIRGAMLWLLLMFAAPGFYRSLALTGFGNHAESTVFGFVAAALLLAVKDSNKPLRQGGTAALAGAVIGLGLWFGPTTLHLLPAVLMLLFWSGRWSILAFVIALPAGLLPGLAYMSARPFALAEAQRWFTSFSLAPPDAMVRWLFTDFVTGTLWRGVPPWASALWWFSLAGVAVAGMVVTPKRTEKTMVARLFVPVAVLSLILAYQVRYDLWADNPVVRGFDPFNLRYRAPMFPLFALAAATAIGTSRHQRLRKLCLVILVVLATTGMMLRLSAWRIAGQDRIHTIGVYAPDAVPDPTVPEGNPPRRLASQMGRNEDIAAAMTFLRSHTDRFEECRAHHQIELGRRLGIAWLESPGEQIPRDVLQSLMRKDDPAMRDHLAKGFARSVVLPDGSPDPRWLEQGKDTMIEVAPELLRPVNRAMERLAP